MCDVSNENTNPIQTEKVDHHAKEVLSLDNDYFIQLEKIYDYSYRKAFTGFARDALMV